MSGFIRFRAITNKSGSWMGINSRALRAWVLMGAMMSLSLSVTAIAPPTPRPAPQIDWAGAAASADARYAAARILATADNEGRPFVIVDKKDARMFVFEADGRLIGASAALLGLAAGDHSVPGIGERELARILPHERTTPSGRFLSEPGRNLQGEAVVWVNYNEGLAIHRLRPGPGHPQRSRSLASSSPDDNRASLGCVIVPVAFYETVVAPLLGKNLGIVYVLPEAVSVTAFFDAQSL